MFLEWIILYSNIFIFVISYNVYSIIIDQWTGTKYDCLYAYIGSNMFSNVIFQSATHDFHHQLKEQIILFCFTVEHFDVNEGACSSNNGILWKFEQLKEQNVTVNDLVDWNATIDIIDEYGYYLETEHNQSKTSHFCNCTDNFHFGRECQYSFSTTDEPFDTLLESHFSNRSIIKGNQQGTMNDADTTCYKRDILCYGNCLDWRQICNGITDCSDGQDEISCELLELNECHDGEYRCQSGHCIPLIFAFDKTHDCADGTDEDSHFITALNQDKCYHKVPNMFCDDYNDAWHKFPCGDGESILMPSHSCANGRHSRTIKQLYIDDPTLCWQYLICKHDLDHLYRSLVNCTALCGNNRFCSVLLSSVCNETIVFFPSRPVTFSPSVYLAYQTNKTEHFAPDYICYTQCDHLYPPSFMYKEYSCRPMTEFFEDLNPFDPLGTVFDNLLHLFDGCIKNRKSNNKSLLFHCPIGGKVISYHRIRDSFEDCYLGLDESLNESACIQNSTQQFRCWTNPNECIPRHFLEDHKKDCSDQSDEFYAVKCMYGTELVCDYQRGIYQPMLIQYRFMVR